MVSAWRIHRLRISGIGFDHVDAVYFKPWGLAIGGERPVMEVLGRGIFEGRRVLLDFKNDRMQISDHLPPGIDNWSSYPLEKTKSGLQITAYTGSVPLRLIIDTGASHSMLFSDRLPAGTCFSGCRTIEPQADNLDCRVTKITLKNNHGKRTDVFAITPDGSTPEQIDFDGLLGMTFMRGRQVFIDMPGNRLYISS